MFDLNQLDDSEPSVQPFLNFFEEEHDLKGSYLPDYEGSRGVTIKNYVICFVLTMESMVYSDSEEEAWALNLETLKWNKLQIRSPQSIFFRESGICVYGEKLVVIGKDRPESSSQNLLMNVVTFDFESKPSYFIFESKLK